MKKEITIGATTYIIEVKLNFKIEKRINGERWHLVLITDNITNDHRKFYIKSLEKLQEIENILADKTITDRIEEQEQLIKLGYK